MNRHDDRVASGLAHVPAVPIEREDHPDEDPAVGDWVWVDFAKDKFDKNDHGGERLGCVVHVGSNYAEVEGVSPKAERDYGNWTVRLALQTFWETCRRAPDAEEHIQGQIETRKAKTLALMGEIKAIAASLSVAPLGLPSADAFAIVKVTDERPIEEYKNALVRAKGETIPELQKKIKAEQTAMSRWMQAPLIPLSAEIEKLGESKSLIEARIFNVELYAGLCERVEQIADGAPAAVDEPIHLLQRRHYMDEECLANYDAGGMRYENIDQFHDWLKRKENRDRILPHKRCVVAFRVRRHKHEPDSTSFSDFISMIFGGQRDWDKTTVLYLRNGEQLFALTTTIEFEEQLFPDLERLDTQQGLWARFFGGGGKVEELITDGEYQEKVKAEEARERRAKAWRKMKLAEKRAWAEANDKLIRHIDWKGEVIKKEFNESYAEREYVGDRDYFRGSENYRPYVPESVYYDDIHKHIANEMLRHNRLVLVLQGLLDRSPTFNPHPKISLASHDGFARAIRLVYDDARALTDGEKPDFEAYRAKLNATLRAGSNVVGQEDAWLRREAERENKRPRYGSSSWSRTEYKRFRPSGDPGPGLVAPIAEWSPRARKATFRWEADKEDWRRYTRGTKPKTIVVPASELLNADAYVPGSYKTFFNDPRTRADYLKWAPLLLAAENFKASKGKKGK